MDLLAINVRPMSSPLEVLPHVLPVPQLHSPLLDRLRVLHVLASV